MAIHVLDAHTAELIAAGEVVERPASVVKELCENAIDAGAHTVTVEIEKGGTALIRVQDDGGGIAPEDIPLAFLRHATSKVRTKEDLDAICTLGFRGEALASVASVAKIELLSAAPDAEFASLYRIEGGREVGLAADARPVGTTITVRDLFYNTPARMKFLKKDASEATFVSETVTRLALSHPEVGFRFVRDGKHVFATPGGGDVQSAAYAVLGRDFARDLLPVDSGEDKYRVRGLVTPPRAGRASRAMQFFFVNGRFVKNRTMMAALEQAYRGMAMQGKFPGCVLFVDMPPELVDVNVHPAKTEVRFARESDVFDAVYRAVRGTLAIGGKAHSTFSFGGEADTAVVQAPNTEGTDIAETNTVKQDDFTEAVREKGSFAASTSGEAVPHSRDAYKASPAAGKTNAQPPAKGQVHAYNQMVDTLASSDVFAPYVTKDTQAGGVAAGAYAASLARLDISGDEADGFVPAATGTAAAKAASSPPAPQAAMSPEQTSLHSAESGKQETPPLRLVGEVFRTYIVAERGDVMCLIDKHAAHERMIYEQLVAARGDTDAQQLLAPVAVALSAAGKNALLESTQALAAAGIEAEDFGGNEVLVRSVPADVEQADIAGLVEEVAGRLVLNSRDALNEKTEWVYHSVACRAAVKAGDKTRPEELLRLAQEILEGRIPPFCPHGRPVVLEIPKKELEKQFGRLG